ncbi:LPS assembly protein LptD [Vibrio sp. SS-MA-C1-2]|uniref:LPS assembly protein LptD n=1 Tax=Vibrio sp. SS-MA-C1-2 TaxID=2908646 RepID=UPI001F2ED099|nr:LPS assembly protein LptD [Vibrio sp. SS-MA-C1-2]UJF19574.1 LPS assembly protein LptD [Vibrio sp. SS-MA-C1-2]
MNFPSRSLLATLITLSLYGPAQADEISTEKKPNFTAVCIAPNDRVKDGNNQPIKVVSDSAKAIDNKKAVYQGNVVITQGDRKLSADKATMTPGTNQVVAEGNVNLQDPTMEIFSDKVVSNLDTHTSEATNVDYQLTCQAGRGEAYKVYQDGKSIYRLQDGTFTTCPAEDKSWRFTATKITHDMDSHFANFYNAKFEVFDVPIMYAPWLRLPVDDARLTGFLYPAIGLSSRDGFEIETPFYWNIAPNYDMTITPKYMSNRGLQLNTLFRYLNTTGTGQLEYEYLGTDDAHQDLDSRWAFNWSHTGRYHDHWYLDANYSKVSDRNYFGDLSSNVGDREDNQLTQEASLAYKDTNWNSSIRVRSFQTLDSDTEPYKLLPQLNYTYYASLPYSLDFKIPTSFSNFDTDADNKPTAQRVHLEPTLTLPIASTWWNMTTEAKVYYSYYNQDNIDNVLDYNGNASLKSTVSRAIPSIKWNAGLELERDTNVFNNDYTQTLEPRVQYLYVPDRDQSDVYQPFNYSGGGYDTTLMESDYYGLFRDQKYSSVDYISAANQFTLGATTRFLDDAYRERFNLSFGQIFYIDPANDDNTSVNTGSHYSAWALNSEFNYQDWLYFYGGMQYDSNTNKMQQANSAVEYRQNHSFVQLNYRYVSKDYIEQTIDLDDNENTITNDGISQLGLITQFSLTKKVNLSAGYYQDLTENIMLESYIGMHYAVDCWAFGINFNRNIINRDDINTESEDYDNNVTFSFSLLGFSDKPEFTVEDSDSSIDYTSPFDLNK